MRHFRFVLFFMLLMFPISNLYASYEVDTDFLYKEESVYKSSKWALDLNYNKDKTESDPEDAQTTKVDVQTNIGGVQRIETALHGFWFDGSFDFEYNKSEDTTGPETTETVDKTYQIKQFEGIYEGFLRYNYCDVGAKRYLTPQIPLYVFGQGLFYWQDQVKDSDASESKATELAAGCGIGYGKIVDLGSYQRIIIVQNELMSAGLLNGKFSRSTIMKLMPFFRKTMDNNERLMEVQAILVGEGLLNNKDITLDIANDILDAIDESFEKREYGFEIRGGYLQELAHKDSDQEKVGKLSAYIKYEKPLSEFHQITARADYFKIIKSDEEDEDLKSEATDIQFKLYLSSQLSSELFTKLGVDYVIRKDYAGAYREDSMSNASSGFQEGKSTKVYLEANYELTDVITWENNASYTINKPDDDTATYDNQKNIVFTSKLTYTFW